MSVNSFIYPWLPEKIKNNEIILTVSQVLARDLINEYDKSQLRLKKQAWATPKIFFWRDWLKNRYLNSTDVGNLLIIDNNISHLLWEQCFQSVLSDPLANINRLASEAQDAFRQLCDFCVPFTEITELENSEETQLFSSVLQLYVEKITKNNWLDSSMLANHLLQYDPEEWLNPKDDKSLSLVGFYEPLPILDQLNTALQSNIEINYMNYAQPASIAGKNSYKDIEAEFRSVGAWARKMLQGHPESKIAVLINDAHQSREIRYLIMEGLSPGWQYNYPHQASLINNRYEGHINNYPIIFNCLLLLKWYQSALSSKEISLLVRSSLFQDINVAGSHSIESKLRLLPERDWQIEEFIEKFKLDSSPDELEVISKLVVFEKTKISRNTNKLIRDWFDIVSADLESLGWPGIDNPTNTDYQLLTRWQDLLNEIESTQIIYDKVSLVYVINRLLNSIENTVFQPEDPLSAITILSFDDAVGMEFDYLWMSGMDNENWPKNLKSSALISSVIQRQYNLPNMQSSASIATQKKLLKSLSSAAANINYSYSINKNDLLLEFTSMIDVGDNTQICSDPDWYLLPFLSQNTIEVKENVPKVQNIEYLAGGVNTIQAYLSDPFSSFVGGRLSVKPLDKFVVGISPFLRGSLLHDSLAELFSIKLSSKDIQSWSENEKKQRIRKAVSLTYDKDINSSGNPILKRLFQLEKSRSELLLANFLANELNRDYFEIQGIEEKLNFTYANLKLSLRVDRVDVYQDNTSHVIDYKTGNSGKAIINSDNAISSIQLFVYAAAIQNQPATASFINFKDKDTINFVSVGLHDFNHCKNNKHKSYDIDIGIDEVHKVLSSISSGDTSINQKTQLDSNNNLRHLHVLSRIQELKNESS